MAPHLTPAELDFMLAKERSGKTPIDIHGLIEARRGRKGVKPSNLAATPRSPQGRGPQARPQGSARPPVWGAHGLFVLATRMDSKLCPKSNSCL